MKNVRARNSGSFDRDYFIEVISSLGIGLWTPLTSVYIFPRLFSFLMGNSNRPMGGSAKVAGPPIPGRPLTVAKTRGFSEMHQTNSLFRDRQLNKIVSVLCIGIVSYR
jgi:hypothetical protein